MKHPDIVVVGTGRSGTSFCAYVLQTRLDVCMAHKWLPATEEVRGGFPYAVGAYEEQPLMALTGRFVKQRDWRNLGWLDTFTQIHAKCKDRLVGVKQWRLAMAKPEHWKHIRPRLVVRTFRPEEPTVVSMTRYRRKANWRNFYWRLENNMRQVVDAPDFLCPVVRVDFTKRVSEAELEQMLRPHVEALRKKR